MTKAQEALWQEMADMTLAKCKEHCHSLGSCCEPVYCHMAAERMQKVGYHFDAIPLNQTFVVDGKCVILPHFRPLCVVHQCHIGGWGFDPKDPEWTQRYFDLREKLDEIESDV